MIAHNRLLNLETVQTPATPATPAPAKHPAPAKRKRQNNARKASSQKRYEYSATAVLRRLGLTHIDEIDDNHIEWFRETSTDLSPVTVENYVKHIEILTGRKFGGDKLEITLKRPETISLEDISRVYRAANRNKHSYIPRFLKYAYITGLRIGDLINLRRCDVKDDAIEVTAQKTGKAHLIPRHYILRTNLPARAWLFGHIHGGVDKRRDVKTLRKRLRYYCDKANVPYFTPQMIRRTAANEYERAHPGAGAVLLGHSLKTVTHQFYLDQFEILSAAQLGLRIPDAFLTKNTRMRKQREDSELLAAFGKLPDVERRALISMISRSAKRR